MVVSRSMDSVSGRHSSGNRSRGAGATSTGIMKGRTCTCPPSPIHASFFPFLSILLLWAFPPAHAFDVTGGATLKAFSMTGENSYTTTFASGQSKLKWPIDVKTAGITLTLSADDLLELELGLASDPWGKSSGHMKDYDYIDESRYPGRTAHSGVDIFSQSGLDSRALICSVRSRVLPLRYRYVSVGVSAGYEYQEFDYRAYDTRQVGFGPWIDQTSSASGPVSTYAAEYDIFSVGLVARSSIENVLILTLDASILPAVRVTDEDDHLRRSRLSTSSCSGSGYQTALSTLFKVSKRCFISTECALSRIHTYGDHEQYWYGDDPASSINDTGQRLTNISAEIDQKTFRASIGAVYRF